MLPKHRKMDAPDTCVLCRNGDIYLIDLKCGCKIHEHCYDDYIDLHNTFVCARCRVETVADQTCVDIYIVGAVIVVMSVMIGCVILGMISAP